MAPVPVPALRSSAAAAAAMLLASSSASGEPAGVRGVAPGDWPLYEAAAGDAAFRCLGAGAGTTLPRSAVNDDFCDCEDGSDEPGTGACAGQSSTMFYCPNSNSFPSYVYASRVNDGVCDCCDGSDEWHTGACTDRCAEEGKVLLAERQRREAELESGLRQRRALLEAARREHEASRQELDDLRRRTQELEAAQESALASLERAKEAAWEEQRRLEEEHGREAAVQEPEASAAAAKPLAAVEESAAAEASEAQPEVPAGSAAAAAAPEPQKPAVAEDVAAAADAAAEGPVISEYTKWMEGAEGVVGKPAASAPQEQEVPSGGSSGGWAERLASAGAGAWASLRDTAERLRVKVFGKRRTPAEAAVDAAEDAHRAAEQQLRKHRQRIEELEGRLERSLDDESLAFAGLTDRCLSKKISEYKYEICFFKEAKQDHTSIGRWKEWESPGVALFADGTWCAGGPARSLRVKFGCGASEELMEISEPSRCTYEAQLQHPAACSEALLESHRKQGPRRPTDEL